VLTHVMEFLVSENLVDKPDNMYTPDLYPKLSYSAVKAKNDNNYPRIKEYSHFSLCITGIIEV